MKVKLVMSPCPYRIESSAQLQEAIELLERKSIRHLPVVEEGEIIGVLSESDARLTLSLCDITHAYPPVGKVCKRSLLVFDEDTDLAEVAREMFDTRADCVLVSGPNDEFTGIFTTADACRVLHLLLEDRE